jgi:hypothetical protein
MYRIKPIVSDHCPSICPEGLNEATKHADLSPFLDSKSEISEYETGLLSTHLWHSVDLT